MKSRNKDGKNVIKNADYNLLIVIGMLKMKS